LEKQYRLPPPDQVHHYEGVFNACLEAGEAGSADAAYRLGVMYFVGIGTERSLRRALVWLHRAEKRGSADAAFMLAVFYLQGIGVKQNDERPRILFLKAALAGIANAQTHMGHYYSEEGPGQDLGEAYRWYRAAAEQGRSIAQVELGRMYRDGRGIARNAEEAFRWFLRAARAGNPYAQLQVAIAYWWGDGVAVDRKASLNWAFRGAKQGDARCQYLIGELFSQQEAPELQIFGYAWLHRAASAGFADAVRRRAELEQHLRIEYVAAGLWLAHRLLPGEDIGAVDEPLMRDR